LIDMLGTPNGKTRYRKEGVALFSSRERLISFPTLVRLLPKACRRVAAVAPEALYEGRQLSRRQYLSRMDRFQHERSGANFRTMSPADQPENAAVLHPVVACLIECF
jgi:hypothetical protein